MNNDYDATSNTTSGTQISNDDVISTLNELIETCRDGQEGFREAAEAVETSDVKSFFLESSQERARFVGELQALVRGLGGDAVNDGSIAGTIHRGWIDLKAAIAGNDEHSVLVECERGEDSAKKTYSEALEANLPANARTTVQTQYDSILKVHDRVKTFRDATSKDNTSSSTASTGGTGGF